jgi:hypothetical protein
VSGPAGMVVDHWAIQVGEGWWEVALWGRPGTVSLSDGLSVGGDIVAEYCIKHSTGDMAASRTGHSFLVARTFVCVFWWWFVIVVGSIVWGWKHGEDLNSVLIRALVFSVPVLVSLIVKKIIPEQYDVLAYQAIVIVFVLIVLGLGIYVSIVRVAAQGTWPGLVVSALLVLFSFLCIGCAYQLCLLGSGWWCGEYSDPR